jgi:hypothetical protein
LTPIYKRKYGGALTSSPEHPGIGAMLQNLSDQVRECLRRAEDCARKAASESDPTARQHYRDNETGWLKLARSYELTEQLTAFSQRASGTFYSIHVRRKTGAWDTELQIRQGKLPISGDEVAVILHGETLKARVIVMTMNPSGMKDNFAVEIIHAEEV